MNKKIYAVVDRKHDEKWYFSKREYANKFLNEIIEDTRTKTNKIRAKQNEQFSHLEFFKPLAPLSKQEVMEEMLNDGWCVEDYKLER